ncbi:hypothetical protein CCY99_07720 [Helicobacter sp. 16-1353]|nr:hypothetical protein CCY99_07720 [Helicobacter sp. 16-1353]
MPFLLFSAQLKITALNATGSKANYAVRITFNQNIKQSDFKKYTIKAGIYYDIKAELTLKRRSFKLGNNVVTIAQFNKNISRIVIETKSPKNLNFNINKNVLTLSFGDSADSAKSSAKTAKDTAKSKIDSKDSASSPIANLFENIDPKAIQADSKDSAKAAKPATKPAQKPTPKQTESPKATTIDSKLKDKIIVLDPGHGGKDCGAQVNRICEKGIVLNITKKARDILKERGYKVFLTRSNDKYISLTARTKFANDKNADVFVSIHANALDKKSKNYKTMNGIETYFLSTARSERARKVAELENKDDIEVMNYFSKLSFLNSINSQRLLASNKLAIDVQSGMLSSAREIYRNTTDGGVREGPFWVLAGALMPSVLVEVGYMTNEGDLKKLQTKAYQDKIALGIANGIESYFVKNF